MSREEDLELAGDGDAEPEKGSPDPNDEGAGGEGEAPALVVPTVPDNQWADLHRAADALKAAAPWKRLFDGDWFGLKDPETGNTYVGSLVGMSGSVLGVQLYLQPEGVVFWNDTVRAGEPDLENYRMRNRMLSIEFVGKGVVDSEDWAVRERLQLAKPPNKGRPYACFRSIRPGFFSWFIEDWEARLLVLAAYASLEHLRSFDHELMDAEDPYPMGDSMPMIPTFSLKNPSDDPSCEDCWERASEEMPLATLPDLEGPSEELLKKLQECQVLEGVSWQMGSFYLIQAMTNWERPYFPRMALVVDPNDGRALGHHVSKPDDAVADQLAKALVEAAGAAGGVPEVIEVNQPLALEALESMESRLGFTVKRRVRLEAWTHTVQAMQRDLAAIPIEK